MEPREKATSTGRADKLSEILRALGVEAPDEKARVLLERFGSFAGLARANVEDIHATLPGDSTIANLVLAAQHIVGAGLQETVNRSTLDPLDENLHNYLRLKLSYRREEVLLGLFADAQGKLIEERVLALGDGHSVTASPTAVLRIATTIGAGRIILVHNHPSGNPVAGRTDLRSMEELKARAAALDLSILDHLIIGGTQIFSMTRGRLL